MSSSSSAALRDVALYLQDYKEEQIRGDSTGNQEWILDAYQALEPRNYLREFTSQNVRPDGRPFSASRPITILQSIFTRNSYGSAMVTIGGSHNVVDDDDTYDCTKTFRPIEATRVVAACTLLVGQPNPSTPTEGDIDVILTASPLSGPRFDIMGRDTVGNGTNIFSLGQYSSSTETESYHIYSENTVSSEQQQRQEQHLHSTPSPIDVKEIESWIRRVLRSSRFINPKELGIESGVSAWRVRLSIHILNHEGNLWDASLLAACAALSDLHIPVIDIERGGAVRIVVQKEDGSGGTNDHARRNTNNVQRREGRSLTLGPPPIPLTIAILSNNGSRGNGNCILLADPTHFEEDVAQGNGVTVVCNTIGEIVEFHKKGADSRLSMEQVAAIGCMGMSRANELEKLIMQTSQ